MRGESDEENRSPDREAQCCFLRLSTRSPIAFISSAEYGSNGPLIALTNSACQFWAVLFQIQGDVRCQCHLLLAIG
jgi:hypothetical protein